MNKNLTLVIIFGIGLLGAVLCSFFAPAAVGIIVASTLFLSVLYVLFAD